MRITDLTIADKHTRYLRKSITMLETLQKRMDYYNKNHQNDLSAGHRSRFLEMQAHLTNAISRLDRYEFISHPELGCLVKLPVSITMEYTFKGLPEPGPAQHDEATAALIELMTNKGREARAKQHQFSLNAEIAYRTTCNWFLLFNTLTVDHTSYIKVFSRDSREFKNYIRNFEREITAAETGTRNDARARKRSRDTINHTYFACVEEGGQGGRLHIHCLHFFRTLPDTWHDPNSARQRPNLRELDRLKRHWKHGFSSPIPVRYSPKDAYGLSGWRWPYDNKTQNALKIGSPLRLGSYMSKYITKGYTSCKRTKLLWRVRKSHKLGHDVITELLSTLTPPTLILLAMDETIRPKLNNQTIPPTLLRQMALKSYQSLSSMPNPKSSVTIKDIATNVMPRPSLLQSLKGSTPTIAVNNQRKTITTLTEIFSLADTSENWEQIYIARKAIDEKYYRRTQSGYGTTATTDYVHAKDTAFAQAHRTKAKMRSALKGPAT